MTISPQPASNKRLTLFVVAGACLCLAAYFGRSLIPGYSSPPDAPRLKMGGTSTAFFIVDRWKTAYYNDKGVKIDFESTGSNKGVGEMIDRNILVGFTHAPLTEKQHGAAKAKGGEILQVPVVLCAVVPVYKIKELADQPPLKFSGAVLADIFLGKIIAWNDPALQALNEGVNLPDTKIAVVHREDSSGTTVIFADYLREASEAWRKQFGTTDAEIKWPVGVGMNRSLGVAMHVAQTEGAIGYVDLLQAVASNLAYGSVENKDKTAFLRAEPDNIVAAAQAVDSEIADDLTFKLVNRPGNNSYPISGAVWAVCYRSQPASQRDSLANFLHWVTHDGQKFAKDRTYAPLPPDLVAKVEKKLTSLKTP